MIVYSIKKQVVVILVRINVKKRGFKRISEPHSYHRSLRVSMELTPEGRLQMLFRFYQRRSVSLVLYASHGTLRLTFRLDGHSVK
jgi:hypothetical protein